MPSGIQLVTLGAPEIVIILLFVVVLLFGAKKIPEIARSIGRARGEFEKGKQEIDKEIKEIAQAPVKKEEESERDRLIKAANALGINTYGKTNEQLREEIQVALNK